MKRVVVVALVDHGCVYRRLPLHCKVSRRRSFAASYLDMLIQFNEAMLCHAPLAHLILGPYASERNKRPFLADALRPLTDLLSGLRKDTAPQMVRRALDGPLQILAFRTDLTVSLRSSVHAGL